MNRILSMLHITGFQDSRADCHEITLMSRPDKDQLRVRRGHTIVR
jgi:hypothetical protein